MHLILTSFEHTQTNSTAENNMTSGTKYVHEANSGLKNSSRIQGKGKEEKQKDQCLWLKLVVTYTVMKIEE